MTVTPVFDRTGFTAKFGALTVPGLNVSSAFNPVPVAKSGEWLGTPTTAGAGTAAPFSSAGFMFFAPIAFADAAALQSIALKVTAAGTLGSGGTFNRIELAIYNDDGSGNLNPGTLLLDAGHIDATSTTWSAGNNIITISQTLPAAGLYWLGAAWQADGTSPGTPTVNTLSGPVIQLSTSNTTPYSANQPTGYLQTGVNGSVPSPAAAARTGASSVPRVLVQHA